MTCRSDEILFCRLLRVIVTKLMVFRKKQTRHFNYPERYIDHGVRSDGVFRSQGAFPCNDIAFLYTTALLVAQIYSSLLKSFELNILQTSMKRRKHRCQNNIKKNLQIFDGIDWTELAENGVKFGGREYSYVFRLPYKTGSPSVNRSTGRVNQLHHQGLCSVGLNYFIRLVNSDLSTGNKMPMWLRLSLYWRRIYRFMGILWGRLVYEFISLAYKHSFVVSKKI